MPKPINILAFFAHPDDETIAFPEHPWPRITNPGDPAHLILDITPALAEKTQAALCHHTQHALFVRRHSQEAGRQLSVPEVIQPSTF
jgi:hypothetical protein